MFAPSDLIFSALLEVVEAKGQHADLEDLTKKIQNCCLIAENVVLRTLMTPLARSQCYTFCNRTHIVYSGAVLEVCMRKLLFYPEIVSFIEDEKDKFPSVKVHYAFNAPPKLIMLDDAGQRKEIIRQVLLCIAAMYCYLLTKLAFQGLDVI
ncbi:Sep15/SelM redox [Cynara cardunculus var. scolymus]|uniref:Selenoprotein F n=2 Tax=Cynara cardunculus var. scolymus TaxID=59895 RepID=A0A103XXL6_CYNCS|nr:Sep15/SelM redox [Cynara cardunculus var. scolymus]